MLITSVLPRKLALVAMLLPFESQFSEQSETAWVTMPALEMLVLRVREVRGDTHPLLRISAPGALLDRMIHESLQRGVTPALGYDCVTFGPSLDVYVDDSLPHDTFAIVLK